MQNTLKLNYGTPSAWHPPTEPTHYTHPQHPPTEPTHSIHPQNPPTEPPTVHTHSTHPQYTPTVHTHITPTVHTHNTHPQNPPTAPTHSTHLLLPEVLPSTLGLLRDPPRLLLSAFRWTTSGGLM